MSSFHEQIRLVTGNPIQVMRFEPGEFQEFKTKYRDDRHGVDNQKMLEYFISYKVLDLVPSDVYIDIAAQDCPFAFFIQDVIGCKVYRQDLYYMKRGIHGSDIGGDASNLPLEDGSVTKISLHNSFEHFEGDSDINFIREAQRILPVGGKMIIIPFFFGDQYSVETEGGWVDDKGKKHLWGKGARFNRYYDVEQFEHRIVRNAPAFNIQFVSIANIHEFGPDCYGHMFTLFEKTK